METSSTAETERIKKRVAPKILKQCMLNLKKDFSVRQPEDELKSALLVSTIHSYFELLVLSVTLFLSELCFKCNLANSHMNALGCFWSIARSYVE